MRKIISEKLKNEIIDFYKSKPMSISNVAKKYNFCNITIRRILKNIPLYSKTQINNPNINEDFFQIIDDEFKAYFLGLIIADGNIFDPKGTDHPGQKWISITLDDNDIYMLEKFKEITGTSTKVASDGRGSSYVAIRSDKMANDLEKYGVIPQKSFKTRFPFEVDKKYYRHLIRGIIDGDGSIQTYWHTPKDGRKRFKHSISCCGTHRLMSEMIDVITKELKLEFKPVVYDYKNRTLSEFKVTNINDMLKFGNWLYDKSNIYLYRKKDNYDMFLNRYKLV